MATKVELYRAMREQGIGKAALSRRLDVHMPQIDRLLDLRHSSQLSQLEKAFHAIDRELEIEVQVVRKPLKARLKASRSKQKSGAM
jgi:antitoxin HicB